MFSENGELVLIVNTFNDHFESIVNKLGLNHKEDLFLSPTKDFDRIRKIINS